MRLQQPGSIDSPTAANSICLRNGRLRFWKQRFPSLTSDRLGSIILLIQSFSLLELSCFGKLTQRFIWTRFVREKSNIA